MIKVKWLKRFNFKDVGHVDDVPKEKAKFWINSGLVEEVKEKKVDAAPKDKAVKGSKNK